MVLKTLVSRADVATEFGHLATDYALYGGEEYELLFTLSDGEYARLEEFTGEKLGTNRTQWNEWLKARTPRTPLPGDTPEKKP